MEAVGEEHSRPAKDAGQSWVSKIRSNFLPQLVDYLLRTGVVLSSLFSNFTRFVRSIQTSFLLSKRSIYVGGEEFLSDHKSTDQKSTFIIATLAH